MWPGPGGCKGGLMDSIVSVYALAVYVLVKCPNECPGPLGGFEDILWSSIQFEGRYGSSPLKVEVSVYCM